MRCRRPGRRRPGGRPIFNHVWTLLRNAPAADDDADRPGSAPVPPGFRPLTPGPALAAARAAVFGSDPDPVMLDCRARLLVRCLLAGPLAPLATARDPRLLLDPFDDAFARDGTWGPRADRPGGTFAGTPLAPDATGRAAFQFLIAAADGRPPRPGLRPGPRRVSLFRPPGGGPVDLPGTGLTYAPPAGGGAVRVDVWLRPALGLADLVAAVDRLPAAERLFAGAAGPWPLLRAAWASDVGPDRGAALALALAYRLEDGEG